MVLKFLDCMDVSSMSNQAGNIRPEYAMVDSGVKTGTTRAFTVNLGH